MERYQVAHPRTIVRERKRAIARDLKSDSLDFSKCGHIRGTAPRASPERTSWTGTISFPAQTPCARRARELKWSLWRTSESGRRLAVNISSTEPRGEEVKVMRA